ncbi:MAG TPA: cyclic nucleotide-binding domain-containing protein [Kofleriaceae bacterium]|jgi:CRP-like cAMP-binding protein|nr:cyclic nucleotide-binding domain-containing protein [Kofleriaceae bacterium]
MSDKRLTRELERDLRKQPDNLPLRLRLAAAYRADQRIAEAVQLYRSVAVAYHSQRRLAQAIAVCKSVLELEPGQPETIALLSELEAMRPEGQADVPPPTGYTPAFGMQALEESQSAALPTAPPTPSAPPHQTLPPPIPSAQPIGTQTPRAGIRMIEQEVAVRDLQPVRRAPVRPLMIPQSPPPVPPPLPRPSTASMTPTPLPTPMPYHEAGDDSMSEITVPPTTIRATAPSPGDWAARGDDAETRIALPRALDEDAETRIADQWKPSPPEPPTPPMARASSTQIDVSAELETRRRVRLDPHELEVLGAVSPMTGPVPRVDDTQDEGEPVDHRSGDQTHETQWPEEATDPRDRARDTQRSASTVTDQSPQAPEVPPDDHDEVPTGVGDVAPSQLFEHSFAETLSHLAPDGQALEGPGAGLLAVFTLLPDHARADLERTMIVRHPAPGETIIREGDRGDSCFVIGQGEVRVLKSDPLGRAEGGGGAHAEPIEVARLGEGSLFGEFALLADRRRHATVEAVGACELYEIPRRALRELAATYPEVGPALERFYRERLLATLLATAPFFQPLPEDQRALLLARFVPLRADSGHTIVQEGERSGGLYLIVLGAVEIVKRGADGRNVLLATLREGAYVGEMSLLRGQPANASVLAAGPVELAFLPPRDFYEVVAGNPALWEQMRREATARTLENAKILAGDTTAV